MSQMQTTLNPRWVAKTSIYLLVALAFGAWGLLDGVYIYPRRGERASSHLELEYLRASEDAGELLTASVPDPEAEYDRLRAERKRIAEAQAGGSAEARADWARLKWLESLSMIGALGPDRTTIEDVFSRKRELEQEWANAEPPAPLRSFDIPSQWLIAAVGFGAAGWLAWLLVSASRKKYGYEPERKALTLPDGTTVTPSDIREVDKRKWDKFFVFLQLEGGREEKLDLLRYKPLEEWVLEIEKDVAGSGEPERRPEGAVAAGEEHA